MAVVKINIVEFRRIVGELVVDESAITGVSNCSEASDCQYMVHIGSRPVQYGIDAQTYEGIKARLQCL